MKGNAPGRGWVNTVYEECDAIYSGFPRRFAEAVNPTDPTDVMTDATGVPHPIAPGPILSPSVEASTRIGWAGIVGLTRRDSAFWLIHPIR